MSDFPYQSISLCLDLALATVSLVLLIAFIYKQVSGVDSFQFQPRRWVPWGMVDIGLILMALVLTQAGTLAVVQWVQSMAGVESDPENLTVDDRILQMLALTASKLLTLFAGLAILKLRSKDYGTHLGWLPSRIIQDLRQGAHAFLLLFVPVFGIQVVLAKFFEPQHPIIKLLQDNSSPLFFAICGVMVVLVAPIVEEFLFRVVIQGWLENIAAFWQSRIDHQRGGDSEANSNMPEYDRVILGGNSDGGLAPTQIRQLEFEPNPCWWPIVASALIFALAHFGNSTDPIPLFVFAMGLGYLYQRTHRILPCIVVHMLLNAFSLLKLWFVLQSNA